MALHVCFFTLSQDGVGGAESGAEASSADHVDVQGRALAGDVRRHPRQTVSSDQRSVRIVTVTHLRSTHEMIFSIFLKNSKITDLDIIEGAVSVARKQSAGRVGVGRHHVVVDVHVREGQRDAISFE